VEFRAAAVVVLAMAGEVTMERWAAVSGHEIRYGKPAVQATVFYDVGHGVSHSIS
jgi:hypothetical protein